MSTSCSNTLLTLVVVSSFFALAAAAQEASPPQKKLFAPKPRYPTDEHGRHPTGSGVVLMHVDTNTGYVISAEMEKSTGHKILDDAALEAFRKWHFKSGHTSKEVRAPISFTHPPNVK